MSFYDRQTVTVDIDADKTVTIRKLSYGEEQAAMSSAMSFEMEMATRKGQAAPPAKGKLDPFRMKREELLMAIVSWAGPGFDGRPVNKDNVDALPPEIIDIIQTAVDKINGGLSDDEKKALALSMNTL